MTAPIDQVLARLENVRRSGRGFRADSPCGNRSRGALSIAESDAGGVLLHDFSGFSVSEVCDAIGLRTSDLFPPRAREQTPADRRENRDRLALTGVRAAAEVLAAEGTIVLSAVGWLLTGEPLRESEIERLRLAERRIDAVRAALSCEVRS
jgi:hypothetical protein